MYPREEIWKQFRDRGSDEYIRYQLILIVLLDIRDLLMKPQTVINNPTFNIPAGGLETALNSMLDKEIEKMRRQGRGNK